MPLSEKKKNTDKIIKVFYRIRITLSTVHTHLTKPVIPFFIERTTIRARTDNKRIHFLQFVCFGDSMLKLFVIYLRLVGCQVIH